METVQEPKESAIGPDDNSYHSSASCGMVPFRDDVAVYHQTAALEDVPFDKLSRSNALRAGHRQHD